MFGLVLRYMDYVERAIDMFAFARDFATGSAQMVVQQCESYQLLASALSHQRRHDKALICYKLIL